MKNPIKTGYVKGSYDAQIYLYKDECGYWYGQMIKGHPRDLKPFDTLKDAEEFWSQIAYSQEEYDAWCEEQSKVKIEPMPITPRTPIYYYDTNFRVRANVVEVRDYLVGNFEYYWVTYKVCETEEEAKKLAKELNDNYNESIHLDVAHNVSFCDVKIDEYGYREFY